MNGLIPLLMSIFLGISLSACNEKSSSQSDTDEQILDLTHVSSTLGTVGYSGEGSKVVLWNNHTTAESGGSYVVESGACHLPCTIFSCPCTKTWNVIIPLTDGANDIVLKDYYDNSYSETVFHTDNGPPEVLSYGELITEGYEEGKYLYVHFNEYMDPSSINDSTFLIEDTNGNRVESLHPTLLNYAYYHNGDKAIIFKCSIDCSGYTVRVTTGVTDYWGTPMSVEYSWSYSDL